MAFGVIFLTLSGCAGKPAGPDVSGEQYVVHGQRYRILGSSKGYVQRGLASWYGEKFHGRLTASGEVYDMEGMTAAHRTLPLGTYVRVRRLDGRGGTVVRVNDRGPFVKGRIIDLSRAAARQLDMLDSGVAEVEVRALGERDRRSSRRETVLKPRRDYTAGSFSVQVGAFTVKDNARRLAVRLRAEYGEADISLFDRGDTVFFRVRVGRFRTEREAERFLGELLEKGEFSEAFVVAR
ncbi:MAG: septal ring lytic transglycosylase RlpA family protein [bacterium]|nr:MAG: septal ring lytic transglycosylase RlpA family protein [bacterium]